jgi:nitroreductase
VDVYQALYTTRAMRRVSADPIPDEGLLRVLDAAIRAPSAGNEHAFRFLVVRDAAPRAEGLGTTVTTLLKSRRAEVDALLGLPADAGYEMAAMVPLGRPTGRWGIAQRRPLHELVYSERWGEAPEWTCAEPLWPDPAGEGAR